MNKILEKVIKDAISSEKCKIGSKDVLNSVNGSKLIVCTSSLSGNVKKEIEDSARSSKVPVYNFNDTSMALGRLCSKPFRISVISIDGASDSDISALLEEIDKEATN
ncbi:MAG: ribosomal L7Ae/L30e/S12e/Gadd45 family protein [Nitrososphaerales archaeon]